MKLAAYSKGGGSSKEGHVEDGEIRSRGGSSMLEYNEHERNTQHRGKVTMKSLGRLVNPVWANRNRSL